MSHCLESRLQYAFLLIPDDPTSGDCVHCHIDWHPWLLALRSIWKHIITWNNSSRKIKNRKRILGGNLTPTWSTTKQEWLHKFWQQIFPPTTPPTPTGISSQTTRRILQFLLQILPRRTTFPLAPWSRADWWLLLAPSQSLPLSLSSLSCSCSAGK